MSELKRTPCDDGISELQGSLILLVIILIAVLAVKSVIGDSVVSAALDFGHFTVWGASNEVSFSKGAPVVTITSPPDGSSFYVDQYRCIAGSVTTAANRSPGLVYFRLNGGPWNKAELNGHSWSSPAVRYAVGSYHVEAVAYDDQGDVSPIASGTFEVLFRLYPDAAYISDDVPGTLTAGDTYDVHINYSNTGYLPWNDTAGYMLSPNGSMMSLSSIGFNGQQVQPHQDHSFSLTLTAPAPGNYTMDYRMWCTDFDWFGDEFSKQVNVVPSFHDARVMAINMPADMVSGQSQSVSITMNNTGTAAWYSDGSSPVYLAMVDGTSGDAFKFNGSSDKILMTPGSVIRNGSEYTFRFKITAPAPGNYYTQYRMMWAGHYVFGQIAGWNINVKPIPTPTPTPTAVPTNKPPVSPTPTPAPQYNAHGKMTLIYARWSSRYKGQIRYYYDGPLGNHFERSSRGASSDNDPTWDWDIGGPNGHYRIYNDVDHYSGGFQFDMNNGGSKGRVIFYK